MIDKVLMQAAPDFDDWTGRAFKYGGKCGHQIIPTFDKSRSPQLRCSGGDLHRIDQELQLREVAFDTFAPDSERAYYRRAMAATLTWNLSDIELSEWTSISFKKPLVLKGVGYTVGPAAFYVIGHPRWPESQLRRVFNKDAEPIITTFQRPSFTPPTAEKSAHLPKPPLWGSTCSFRDDYGNRSVRIKRVRLGDVKFKTEGKPEVHGTNVGGISVETDVGMAIDPTVHVTVLLPWHTTGDRDLTDLNNHVDQLARNFSHDVDEDYKAVTTALRRIFADSLPTEPPRGWRFSVEPDELSAKEGSSERLTINVSTPSPGFAAFALRLTSTDDPELSAVSDIALVVAESADIPPVVYVPEEWDEPPPIEQLSPLKPSTGSGRFLR